MIKIINKKMRKNGFNLPLNPLQILTIFIYILDLISYFSIDMICLSYNMTCLISLSVFYIVLALGTFYNAFKATLIDPTDQTIKLFSLCK